MLKRLTVAVAALFVLASSAFGAGTIPGFSLAQQQDSNGTPLAGCKLYIIQAGTTSTPQNGYSDSALTLPLTNPVVCDAYGRLPQIFLADGSIKLRLTKSSGVQVFAADGVLVVGASSGGGGGSTVDATTVLATGDIKARYGTGVLTGFVRLNGRTIGSSTSGASERANADCQSAFEYLWNADANLTVSTGRGLSANADWVANKTITLPDWRGRAVGGLDDMGSTAAGRLTADGFGTTATVLGAAGGRELQNIGIANINAFTPTVGSSTFNLSSLAITYPVRTFAGTGSTVATDLALGSNNGSPAGTLTATPGGSISATITMNSLGSGTAFAIASPMKLATIYMKL
jgi:hypothetical protein